MLGEVLKTVPKVSYAAAYGSAVIAQSGYQGSNMIDYIFAVNDAKQVSSFIYLFASLICIMNGGARQWHRENLRMNGTNHYSFLCHLGPTCLAAIQVQNLGWSEATLCISCSSEYCVPSEISNLTQPQSIGAGVYFNVPRVTNGRSAALFLLTS